ncbi:MAG: hypothetical protein JSS65_05895 [Armatimonadetes bacterium]|nr:hypothetical protein [Armatimonadota bacterium]
MSDKTLSRRSLLGGAVTVALVPALVSESAAAEPAPKRPAQPFERENGRPRFLHTATALLDGTVLMVGGYHTDEATRAKRGGMPSNSVEIYEPSSGTWQEAAPMAHARARHAATLLPDGRVAVSGGVSHIALDSVEIYDPSSNQWTIGEPLPKPMFDHAMSAVQGGVVLSGGDSGAPAINHVIKRQREVPFPTE